MYSINQPNYDYYSSQNDFTNSNEISFNSSNIEHNMYYSSCGKEMWINNYTYKQDQYTHVIRAPSYNNIYDIVQQNISPIINKGKKHLLENEDVIVKPRCHKLFKTDFISKASNSNIHNSSISSCFSPTTSVTSSSNNSSSDEQVYELLFKAYQTGSLSKSKYRRLMANERERKRMHGLNTAFENLRSVLPSLGSNKQFSKFETLQMAKSYIAALRELLNVNQDSIDPIKQFDFSNSETQINSRNVKIEKSDLNYIGTKNSITY